MWFETIITAIMAIATYGLKKLVNYLIKRMEANDAQKEAFQALLEGMAKAQDEIIREAKKASADGRLTQEEIGQAKEIAWEHAKAAAVGPAKDIIVSWTSERVSSYIKQFLAKTKTSS